MNRNEKRNSAGNKNTNKFHPGNSLVITQVKVRLVPQQSGNPLRAFATIVFNDSLLVDDIRIIEGKKRLFVAMPTRKTKDGNYVEIVHPINSETRQLIEDSILTNYRLILSSLNNNA